MNSTNLDEFDEVTATIREFLSILNVKVTDRSIKRIKLDPTYPSLQSISSALHEWNIPNLGVGLSVEQLRSVGSPILVHTKDDPGNFAIVKRIDNEVVHYYNSGTGNASKTLSDFIKGWSGFALLVDSSAKASEDDYTQKRILELLIRARFSAAWILAVIVFGMIGLKSPILGGHFLISFAGAFVCWSLFMHSVGIKTGLAKSVCLLNSKIDCARVLDSKAAHIYGDITLAELGFIYFAAGALITSIGSVLSLPNINVAYFYLTGALLPFTFLSIGYQWLKVKSWCLLCVSIMIMLWISAILQFVFLSSASSSIHMFVFAMAFAIVILIWFSLRSIIVNAFKVPNLELSLRAFKRNEVIFKELIALQHTRSSPIWNDVEFGEQTAPILITFVSNPVCKPCVEAHAKISRWTAKFKHVKIRYVFWCDVKDEKSHSYLAAKHLVGLSLHSSKSQFIAAIEAWYSSSRPSLESWQATYPVSVMDDSMVSLQQHLEWCQVNQISSTPAVLLNGQQIPDYYDLGDVEYFLNLDVLKGV